MFIYKASARSLGVVGDWAVDGKHASIHHIVHRTVSTHHITHRAGRFQEPGGQTDGEIKCMQEGATRKQGNPIRMNTLKKFSGCISNFKSARPLLSTLFAREARAILCEHSLKLGGVGINDRKERRAFSDLSQYVLC